MKKWKVVRDQWRREENAVITEVVEEVKADYFQADKEKVTFYYQFGAKVACFWNPISVMEVE